MEFSPRKCLYAATILAAFAILSTTFFSLLGRRSIIGFARRVLRGSDRKMDTVATPVARPSFQAGRHTAATEAQHDARQGLAKDI
jgi:hypothetical protein